MYLVHNEIKEAVNEWQKFPTKVSIPKRPEGLHDNLDSESRSSHAVRKKQPRYGAPAGASKVIPQVQMNLLCLCQGLFCDFAVTSQLPFVCGSFRDLLSSALLSMTSFPSGLNQILVFLSLTIDISAVATSCGHTGALSACLCFSNLFPPLFHYL